MITDIQTFTQLALGYLNLDSALYKNGIRCNANKDILNKVFIKKDIFFTDRF